jgi:hypothetical protein
MNAMRDEDIRAIVAETVAEQQRLHLNDMDAVVCRTIATILTSFGIEEEDRQELRADFLHLRRWRKSVEQAPRTILLPRTILSAPVIGCISRRLPGLGRTRCIGANPSSESLPI